MSEQTKPSELPESNRVKFTAYLVPSDDYITNVLSFPGQNCMPPYGLEGKFSLHFSFYSKGKVVATLDSVECDQNGRLEVDFESIVSQVKLAENSIVIVDYSHTRTVPVELYFSSIHRKTQSYHAYPALNFMGDTIYPDFHDHQLESTLFWPGIAESEEYETCLVVVNPYKLSFSFQASIFCDNILLGQTPAQKAQPFSAKVLPIKELFPEQYEVILNSNGRCAVCVAAQYKVVSYVMFRDRRSGLITTIDHMHSYQLV